MDLRPPPARKLTWLTHWGLYADNKVGGWAKAHRVGHDVVIPVGGRAAGGRQAVGGRWAGGWLLVG